MSLLLLTIGPPSGTIPVTLPRQLLRGRDGNRAQFTCAESHAVFPVGVPWDRFEPERGDDLPDGDVWLFTSRGHGQDGRPVLVEGLDLGLEHWRTVARVLLLAVLVELGLRVE